MEHEDAIRSQAAERYVARSLSPAEQNAFEEHFFDCPECAEEVRWEQVFIANGRAVAREQAAAVRLLPSPVARQQNWLQKLRGGLSWRPALPLSLAANFAMAAGLVAVLTIPTHQPGTTQLTKAYFAPGPAHGDDDVHILPPRVPYYLVRFPSPRVPSYSYEIADSAGRRELSGSLQAPAGEDETLFLPVPVGTLPPGVHTLTVHGLPAGDIVSRSRFQTSR